MTELETTNLEKMILEKCWELPVLPEGYYYDFSVEESFNSNSQQIVWTVVVTPVRRQTVYYDLLTGKKTILDR